MKTPKFAILTVLEIRSRSNKISVVFVSGQCNSDYSNSPPYLNVNGDRVWTLSESTSVNTTLGRASGEDNENDPLTYGIESKEPGKHIPFGIDPENGFIYLNESLEGKVSLVSFSLLLCQTSCKFVAVCMKSCDQIVC